MTAIQRAFSEADRHEMVALAHVRRGDNLHVADLPYRLSSWALDDPENVGLWVNAQGRLVAWAVMQTPFWAIDYVCLAQAGADLHRRILAWADDHACTVLGPPSGHPMWFVNVFAGQADRIRDLEDAGFASQADVGEDSWSKVLMLRPADRPIVDCALPPGFSIRPLAGEQEVEAYWDWDGRFSPKACGAFSTMAHNGSGKRPTTIGRPFSISTRPLALV